MRIIVADHHTQPRWALTTLLEEQPEFSIIGAVADAQELLLLVEEHTPDLVLIDGGLPGLRMEDLITRLHTLKPKPTVVVMSGEIEDGRKLLKAGADAFVSKAEAPDWLLETLQKYETRVNNHE
jgi:DNA-binding NarL/FixJ family response regulator